MGAGSLARLEEEGEGPGSWIQQAWLKKQTQKHYIFILREKWQRHTAGLEDHDTRTGEGLSAVSLYVTLRGGRIGRIPLP